MLVGFFWHITREKWADALFFLIGLVKEGVAMWRWPFICLCKEVFWGGEILQQQVNRFLGGNSANRVFPGAGLYLLGHYSYYHRWTY